jgi:hypothetical protein
MRTQILELHTGGSESITDITAQCGDFVAEDPAFLAKLFSGEFETLDVLKLKDVVEALEGAIDAFQDTDREVLPDTAWQFILYFARQAKGPFLLLLIVGGLAGAVAFIARLPRVVMNPASERVGGTPD